MICGGVLVPDLNGVWYRTCFIESGRLPLEKYTPERLALTRDHFIPRSQGGADGPTHFTHRYCQCVQGWMIGARNAPQAARNGGRISGGNRAAARALAEWNRSPAGRGAAAKGNCAYWRIRRGLPCVCGQHMKVAV